MKTQTSHKESRVNRLHLLTMAISLVIVLVTVCVVIFSISGCKEQNALGGQNVNIPMAQVSNFVGSPDSRIYHLITCKNKPTKGQLVYFDSPVAAHRAGYRPCAICHPNVP